MYDDLIPLYQSLQPAPHSPVITDNRLERLGAASAGGNSGGWESALGATADHSPLRLEEFDQLERLFQLDPEAVRDFLGRAQGRGPVTAEEARQMLDAIRNRLANPATSADILERVHQPQPPPEGFTFDLYDPSTIPIDVSLTAFEEGADWFRYAVGAGLNGALFHAGLLPADPFRRHEAAPSRFTYALDANPGDDLWVALFADFANGYYHSRYMARRFAKMRYPYAIHLGDVYYAGREAEVQAYLEEPLEPVLAATELFLLQGNHEMYSRARPWMAYLDRKRRKAPSKQRQEGTYFRLLRDKFQVLGVDTEWFGLSRCRDAGMRAWLRDALKQGREEGRMNILLTSDEPYCYGKAGTTALFGDLADVVGEHLVDVWFWGNTHHCALFPRSADLPFIGSCIGHGGFPYKCVSPGARDPLPPRFVETGSRFGEGTWPDPRPDIGNNGFCELTLHRDGQLSLNYIDWRGRTRHRAVLAGAGGVVNFV